MLHRLAEGYEPGERHKQQERRHDGEQDVNGKAVSVGQAWSIPGLAAAAVAAATAALGAPSAAGIEGV